MNKSIELGVDFLLMSNKIMNESLDRYEKENIKLKQMLDILRKANEDIVNNWDISNMERVLPKHHKGELYPNDSLAAGAIARCFNAKKQVDLLLGDL